MAVLSVRGGPFQIFSDHACDVSRTCKKNGSADRVHAMGAGVGIRMTTTEATIRSGKVMALFSGSLWSGLITFSELYGNVLADEIADFCAKRRQLDLNSNTREQVVDKLTLACEHETPRDHMAVDGPSIVSLLIASCTLGGYDRHQTCWRHGPG